MKKTLFRMKQLADQTVGRAEKTQVLSEDLVALKKKCESMEVAIQVVCKKLRDAQRISHGSTQDNIERNLRKMPEYNLSLSLMDCSANLGDCLLGTTFNITANAFNTLATEALQYQKDVETNILLPLNSYLENEVPTIKKLRTNLQRLTLDMDAAKSRYQSCPPNKQEQLHEEMEECRMKVEQCRNQLTTEMLNFVAKECEISKILADLVDTQVNFHDQAFSKMQTYLPNFQEQLENALKPTFGSSLDEHLQTAKRPIAVVIEACVCALLENAMNEEGLFRIAGSAYLLKKLKAAFDAGVIDISAYDTHVIAGALKSYLRELKEPLLTFPLYNEWIAASKVTDEGERLQALWTVVQKLPQSHYENLQYIVKFFSRLAANYKVNKMSASNIAIVIGPNLLWPETEEVGKVDSVFSSALPTAGPCIMELLVTNADWFFPGEYEFDKGLLESMEKLSAQSEDENTVQSDDDGPIETEDSAEVLQVPPPAQPVLNSSSSDSPSPQSTLKRRKKPAPQPPTAAPPPRSPSPIVAQPEQPLIDFDEKPVAPNKPARQRPVQQPPPPPFDATTPDLLIPTRNASAAPKLDKPVPPQRPPQPAIHDSKEQRSTSLGEETHL